MNEAAEQRELIYGSIRKEGIFTWDYLHGEQYALAGVHRISPHMLEELAAATEQLGHIFQRMVEVVRLGDNQLLLALGVPEAALEAVRISVLETIPTLMGRFDFADTAQGIKMLEFNSDTPTGIVEAYYVNEKVCAHYGVPNPNAGMERHFPEAFQMIIEAYAQAGYATEHIYFSALDWHEEDAATARYLLQQSGLKGQFVPLADLRVYEDRLQVITVDGHQPVDVLYRLHALEKLAEDTDNDGYPTGAQVLDLIARRKLAIINPPTAFLAQTKALQAIIWSLHEAGQFFSPEEHQSIARYMLPTYMENRFAGKLPYVKKPILGREGGGVTLFHASGDWMERDHDDFYWEQPMVYQQLVELSKLEVQTVTGPYEGYLLWGSFLIGGRPSAVVARIGEKITGNLSCYVPITLSDEMEFVVKNAQRNNGLNN